MDLVDFGCKDFQLFRENVSNSTGYRFQEGQKRQAIIPNETLLSNVTNHNTLIALV